MEIIHDSKCYECGEVVNPVIQLGEKPNWESITTYICLDCLMKAKEFFMEALK